MLVDTVIALLRENTPASLAEASALAGIEITKCPPAVPPWPPKAVEKKKTRSQKIVRSISSNVVRRYRRARIGMTREELLLCGLPRRSILTWTDNGNIKWNT